MLCPTAIRSTAIGWAMGVGRFGQLIGPIVVGWMLAAHLGEPGVFFAAALACIISAISAGLLSISLLQRVSPGLHMASDVKSDI
jgi:AAHS family 4-hydroxybenzoate transporter-like MFS transporter